MRPLAKFRSSLLAVVLAAAPAVAQQTPAAPPADDTKPATTDAAKPADATQTGATSATPGQATAPAAGTAEPAPPVKQPKLVADKTVIDAGRFSRGDRIEVEFTLANQGDGELDIRTVQPACGCTVASFDRQIAPGATGKVHAYVDTSNFAGVIAKALTVLSNDPVTPRLQLTIKAEVQAHVLSEPSYVRFVATRTVPTPPAGVTVYSPDDPSFKVTGVRSDLPFVTARFREATPAERLPAVQGPQWRIEAELADDAPVGPLSNFLVVTTSHPKQPELDLPLSGVVRPVLHLTPEKADFGDLTLAGQARQMVLTLINFGTAAVAVSAVSTDVAGVKAHADEVEAGKRWRIVVELPAGMAKGRIDGHLRIATSSATMPELVVPLVGRIG
jgi:hypothetical protein